MPYILAVTFSKWSVHSVPTGMCGTIDTALQKATKYVRISEYHKIRNTDICKVVWIL